MEYPTIATVVNGADSLKIIRRSLKGMRRKPLGKHPFGRMRRRWEANIKTEL
jgi:hypothetical protein